MRDEPSNGVKPSSDFVPRVFSGVFSEDPGYEVDFKKGRVHYLNPRVLLLVTILRVNKNLMYKGSFVEQITLSVKSLV